MKSPRLTPFLFTLCSAVLAMAPVQSMGQVASIRNSSAYEQAARPLRNAPSRSYKFSQAVLSDVLRLMAEDAGINFISLPVDQQNGGRLVTFTLEGSPFESLETIAQDNGVALVHNGSYWSLKPTTSSELVAKNYKIAHNTKEKITFSGGGGGGSGGGSNSRNSSSGGGGGGGGGISTGIDLQGGDGPVFEVEESLLIDDVKEILGISSRGNALLSRDAYLQAVQGGGGGPNVLTPLSTGLVQNEQENDAKVIWNPDTSSLFVVATLQQHAMVAEYLAEADKPQNLIAVEVKFFETTKDPKRQLGIDWSAALGDTGVGFDLSGLDTNLDFNFLKNTIAPDTAVLNATDVSVTLRALLSDQETTQVSYPRVLTVNNREVVIRSVINEPVLAASASTTPGAGATTTSSVQYLPIGTVINLLPREMGDDTVLLDVSLTVSSIIGERMISGNPYPIASSRVYNSPLRVKSGYTVAIAGLDEALNTNGKSAVPVLGKIPAFGQLFRNRSKKHSRKNLMMFITPTLLKSNTRGVSESPQTLFTNPADRSRYLYGSGGGYDETVSEWDRELVMIEQKAKEGYAKKEDFQVVEGIYTESAGRMKVVQAFRKTRSMSPEEVQSRMQSLRSINSRAGRLRKKLWFAKP